MAKTEYVPHTLASDYFTQALLIYGAFRRSLPNGRRQMHSDDAVWRELFNDWNGKYGGPALKAFTEFLTHQEEASRSEKPGPKSIQHYSKCIAVLQSSGTGKSRLMSELGSGMFSISFTFRPEGSTGYPPGDSEVLEFLRAGTTDSLDVHSRAISMLSASLQFGSIPELVLLGVEGAD
jgi:hypothetical protein